MFFVYNRYTNRISLELGSLFNSILKFSGNHNTGVIYDKCKAKIDNCYKVICDASNLVIWFELSINGTHHGRYLDLINVMACVYIR